MTEFLHTEDLNDRKRLDAFPSFVKESVELALGTKFVRSEMLPFLRPAWQEILDAGELGRLRTAIQTAKDPALREHGLQGAQLEVKRQRILRWFNRFGAEVKGWLLRRLLGSIRALLDSLLDALGLGGLLREFLDVLGDSIEDEPEKA